MLFGLGQLLVVVAILLGISCLVYLTNKGHIGEWWLGIFAAPFIYLWGETGYKVFINKDG
jgi:hypothetical protein